MKRRLEWITPNALVRVALGRLPALESLVPEQGRADLGPHQVELARAEQVPDPDVTDRWDGWEFHQGVHLGATDRLRNLYALLNLTRI